MSRYKGRTYGECMHYWTEDDDYRYWKRRYESAVEVKNYDKVKDLLSEAKIYGYDIPSTTDSEIMKIIKSVQEWASRQTSNLTCGEFRRLIFVFTKLCRIMVLARFHSIPLYSNLYYVKWKLVWTKRINCCII